MMANYLSMKPSESKIEHRESTKKRHILYTVYTVYTDGHVMVFLKFCDFETCSKSCLILWIMTSVINLNEIPFEPYIISDFRT